MAYTSSDVSKTITIALKTQLLNFSTQPPKDTGIRTISRTRDKSKEPP